MATTATSNVVKAAGATPASAVGSGAASTPPGTRTPLGAGGGKPQTTTTATGNAAPTKPSGATSSPAKHLKGAAAAVVAVQEPAHNVSTNTLQLLRGSQAGHRTSTLVSSRVWEIYSPPPANSLSGALVPRVLMKHRRRRKICVEVHRVIAEGASTTSKTAKIATAISGSTPMKDRNSYEECIVRILDPANVTERKAALQRAKHKGSSSSAAADDNGDEDFDEDGSVSPAIAEALLDKNSEFFVAPVDAGWKTKYRFPVRALSVKGTSKSGVICQIDLPKLKHTRELIFDSKEEAEDFKAVLQHQLQLEGERAERKLLASLGGTVLPTATAEVTFLIEIVSAWDLPAGDLFTSDPYVICMLKNKEVHRTQYIPRTLDPIWTLKTGSLFLLPVDLREFFAGDGLLFIVMDFDKIGSNEALGAVSVLPKMLYEAQGERMEFPLGPAPGGSSVKPSGYLAIRCRRASDYDIKFMNDFKKGETNIDNDAALESRGGKGALASYFTEHSRVLKDGKQKTKQYKIRPGPDPKRVEETTWMTKEEIESEVMKDSHHWIETGTGRLGRLFVEIIGCDNLPNLDMGGANKTDAFVAAVFEDSIVSTDVVSDCLNPRWMPWAKRAFIFHIYHSSSHLFLGCFDHDIGIGPGSAHDPIGRVSVDLSNLRKDTLYTLQYNLYTSAQMPARESFGTITIRLRLDIESERKSLLSTLEIPPQMYVNVKRRKDFHVVRYAVLGKYDMSQFNLKYIEAHLDELYALIYGLFFVQDAVEHLLLWRGSTPVPWMGWKVPLHSLVAFIVAITLVERPQLIPSFACLSLAWILLAIMEYRRNLPLAWDRCKSFHEFATALALGDAPEPPANIKANENNEKVQQYINAWRKRIEDFEAARLKAYAEALKAQEEYMKELQEIGEIETDLSTKSGGFSILPFKAYFYPLQQALGLLCRYLRYVKNVLIWEECYISYWVVTACFILSVVSVFVPWFFFIRWSARIIVWAVFGPWMKLVDVYYISNRKPLTPEEIAHQKELERQKRRENTSTLAAQARIARENATKLKVMKAHIFGHYSTRVPILKEDRFRDVPLPSSTAVPYRPTPLPLSELAMRDAGYGKTRVPGQHLVGDMIPQVQSPGFTDAPIGQATAYPRHLDRKMPTGPESTAEAYAKIASLIFTAAVISWFVVPLFASLTEKAFYWI